MKKGTKLTTLALAVFSGLFLLSSVEANAELNMVLQSASQSQKVTGQVFDELGEPMIGVTVAVKGTTNATVPILTVTLHCQYQVRKQLWNFVISVIRQPL